MHASSLSPQFAIEQKLQIVKDRRQNYGVYHHISFTSECLVVCKCISITLTSSIEQMRAQPSIWSWLSANFHELWSKTDDLWSNNIFLFVPLTEALRTTRFDVVPTDTIPTYHASSHDAPAWFFHEVGWSSIACRSACSWHGRGIVCTTTSIVALKCFLFTRVLSEREDFFVEVWQSFPRRDATRWRRNCIVRRNHRNRQSSPGHKLMGGSWVGRWRMMVVLEWWCRRGGWDFEKLEAGFFIRKLVF